MNIYKDFERTYKKLSKEADELFDWLTENAGAPEWEVKYGKYKALREVVNRFEWLLYE